MSSAREPAGLDRDGVDGDVVEGDVVEGDAVDGDAVDGDAVDRGGTDLRGVDRGGADRGELDRRGLDRRDLDPGELAARERFLDALLRRLVSDPELRADVAQETWLAALQRSAAARLVERAWLGTVARNFAFQALRGRARRLAREAAVAREELQPAEHDASDPELRRRVLAAVDALPEPYRTAVRLRFFEDLMPAEIAERIGARPETVRTRIKRGLAQIRARLRG